jgi:hypothetical protein
MDISENGDGILETHGGKAVRFRWGLRNDCIKITKEGNEPLHEYSLDEILNILIWLTEKFASNCFPLGNDVQKLWKGTEVDGLGVAIFHLRPGDTHHAQGASYLGVLLEDVGILEWNNKKKGIQWSIICPVTNIDQLRKKFRAKTVQNAPE